MKKVLWILVLSLLTCNISFADNLKIVDGDIVVLNGEKIRFSGIDTLEVVMLLPIENIQRNLLKMKTLQKLTN